MVIRRMSVLTVLVAMLAAAGCARDAGSDAPGAPAPDSSAASGSSPGSGSSAAPGSSGASGSPASPGSTELPATDLPPPGKSDPTAAGAQTVSGTVAAGVEPGCLLLTGDGAARLLIFDDPAIRSAAPVGAKVTVTGRAEPDMMSTCQQGTPFIVTSVQPSS